MSSTLKEIKNLTEFDEQLNKHKIVIVDFYTETCPPCKAISPLFQKLAEENKKENVLFCKVNCRVAEDVAEKCDITSVPTFLFYESCSNEDVIEGADEKALREKVKLWVAKA